MAFYYGAAARAKRINIFKNTKEMIENDQQIKDATAKCIAAQEFYPEGELQTYDANRFEEEAHVVVTGLRSFEAASKYHDGKVAVLNFASATTPGGGVTKGSNAQEESLCRVSNLYPCLIVPEMDKLFYAPHLDQPTTHNDDVIYTPDVLVFKDDDCVELPVAKRFSVDVITCAAPNLRPSPNNRYNKETGDKIELTSGELYNLHVRRARAIMSSAAHNGADVIILGAFGCGAFMNDPVIVAKAYQKVVKEFAHAFKVIHFAIYCGKKESENYTTFKAMLNS